MMKSQYGHVARAIIVLGGATLVALALLAWTQPFDREYLSLRWDASRGTVLPPSQNMMREAARSRGNMTINVERRANSTKAVELRGNSTKVVEPRGNTTKAVDLRGNTTKAVEPGGNTTKAVEARGNTTEGITTKGVERGGNTTRVVESRGNTTKAVEVRGNKTKAVEPRGGATKDEGSRGNRTKDVELCGKEAAADDVLQQRGVGLLHSWTDAELFLRAVSMEKTTSRGKTSTSTGPKKIAFLFLMQSNLPFARLWNKFFKGNEDLYNIYVHMWPLKLSTLHKSMGVFYGRAVPSQEGRRLTPGLIADARRLLANALLDDPSNEWFAIVSESCIPLHGFRHVYDTLASTNKSFLDVSPRHWDMPNRYKARGDTAMQPELQFSQFRVGSQFWVMRRKHALMTVGDIKYWNKFNRPCLPQYVNCFPEEHYFATLMNVLDPGGTAYSATLVDWSRMEPGGHPRRFRAAEISRDFITNLQGLADGRFLFARKFEPQCLGLLLDISDTILDH